MSALGRKLLELLAFVVLVGTLLGARLRRRVAADREAHTARVLDLEQLVRAYLHGPPPPSGPYRSEPRGPLSWPADALAPRGLHELVDRNTRTDVEEREAEELRAASRVKRPRDWVVPPAPAPIPTPRTTVVSDTVVSDTVVSDGRKLLEERRT